MHHGTLSCSKSSRTCPAQVSVSKLPLALCALLLTSAFWAWAQGAGGTLLGTVTDPSGGCRSQRSYHGYEYRHESGHPRHDNPKW